MGEMCGDNRFEIIGKAKTALLDGTNISTSQEEMNVIDNVLFRCWQMGWLDRFDDVPVVKVEWEVVEGVLTPGGDPLLRCPICKSRESYHMGGIEMPVHWNYCPVCGTKIEGRP